MVLLCLLVALVLLQSQTVTDSIQKDQWFDSWLSWLDTKVNGAENTLLFALLALALPLLALSIGLALLAKISVFLVFLVSILLLLYGFGRGNWTDSLYNLRSAYLSEDADTVREQLTHWLPVSKDTEGGWREQAMTSVIYCAFERTFVVLFWFILLGPIGAVLYRLIALLQNYTDLNSIGKNAVERWQWLLEWPAARLLGFSLAVVGNFAGCFHQWKICALCSQRSTSTVLTHYIRGALTSYQEDNNTSADDIELDIDAVIELYKRSLLLWICVLAIFWII